MCSDRLDIFKRWIGVATLRVFDVPDVPEELKLEPLAGMFLTSRILVCINHALDRPHCSSTLSASFLI
jgi:hypothetical protein